MEIEKIFYKIVDSRNNFYDYNGVFVLRNGLNVPVENMIYWDFGFPKWQFLNCRINVVYNKDKVINLFYYPNGKINISGDNEFDIVEFIEFY